MAKGQDYNMTSSVIEFSCRSHSYLCS